MNNLRKVTNKQERENECILHLECGHNRSVDLKYSHLTEMACYQCTKDGDGYMTHYYHKDYGVLPIEEVDRKCHLCYEIDKFSNLTPCLSSNGTYYYSHKSCIDKNNGYATRKDNPTKEKKNTKSEPTRKREKKETIKVIEEAQELGKHECKICKSKFNNGYKLYGDKPRGKPHKFICICEECFVSTKLINMSKFKILECKSTTLHSNEIYNICRNSIQSWKVDWFTIKRLFAYKQGGDLNTVHHANFRFIDILYTYMRLCNVDEKDKYTDIEIKEIKNCVIVMHWFNVIGVAMNYSKHEEYHKTYGVRNADINLESLKTFFNDERISKSIDMISEKLEVKRKYITNRDYEKFR